MHSHRTEDCHQLREEVARLLNKGHPREFLSDRDKNQFREMEATKKNEANEPQHVIHMIMGGADAPKEPVMGSTKISITREKWTRGYIPEDALTFKEEDTEALSRPHNDALLGKYYQVKGDRTARTAQTNCARHSSPQWIQHGGETTKGEIVLPVTVVGTSQDTKFLVFEGDMRYNALFGRPWIQCMRAVASTLVNRIKII
uniref:Uncharacterized protein n=1 Tax=Nicotiana tabacum TaxID=4097 RepID=A0A1S4CDJ0_TOBAC|nr:PREDICTED: uncharacterized protein LOC107817813 [Nicotiana tabacum]